MVNDWWWDILTIRVRCSEQTSSCFWSGWAVEVEVVQAQLLAENSKRTRLVTSSIGAGSGGDIQFMFAEDILGCHALPYPRHTKQN